MMELISKYLDRPFYKVDSTQITIPGYVGKDIAKAKGSDKINSHYRKGIEESLASKKSLILSSDISPKRHLLPFAADIIFLHSYERLFI